MKGEKVNKRLLGARFGWRLFLCFCGIMFFLFAGFHGISFVQSNNMSPAAIKVPAPPRTLNVRKFAESRAGEVEGLHSILADRLGNNFRSQRNKRRRTAAHDNQLANRRFRKRQRNLLLISANSVGDSIDSRKVSRRVRRRNEFKKNPLSGFTTSGDGTKRLRTHVWHAKRFTMTKLWGFYLPLGLHGRGRGSRALLKWYKKGVVVHDASYNLVIQLEGPEESLISVLNRVLVPSPSVDFGGISQAILSGAEYGIAMLHHVRAQDTDPISPVIYTWRPLEEKNLGAVDSTSLSSGKNECSDALGSSLYRQCWVWIHASAFVDGHNAIRCACQKEMEENGILINCSSLEGELAKIDVLGSNASRLLKQLLHSVPQVQCRPFQLKKCSTVAADKDLHSIDYHMLENEGFSRAVISLIVRDPRLFKDTLKTPSTGSIDEVITNQSEILAESCPAVGEPQDEGSDVGLAHHNLWDVDGRIRPPVDEAFLSMEKHRKRMDSFYLSHCDPEMPNCSDISQCSRSCPIVVMRNNSLGKRFLGWSIILPVSWVKAVWIPLVTNGARAIGLRERHWIACESCLPCFPLDYADCHAYVSYLTSKADASCLKRNSQPPAVRAPKIPILPPWNTIQLFEKAHDMEGDGPVGKEGNMSNGIPPTADCCDFDFVRNDASVGNFGGFVARTTTELSLIHHNNCSSNSFLFPRKDEKVSTSQKVVYNNDNIESGTSRINYNQKPCFLRVILRTFKEGVFEEGAVVCAPKFTDILLWTRQENGQTGLQMPQASVSSYFAEVSSGKWQLPLPEDPSAQEFHRTPIGFVTTGFVHGSKKPLAIGYCEATSLAHLRKDEWPNVSEKRRKNEIYVLVRNLRSSAYRLGLATIVLEQHEKDLEFL